EQGKPRIAIANFEITQDLVVRPVLLDDVNHVLDVLPKEGKQPSIGGCLVRTVEVVVSSDLLREAGQSVGARGGDGQKPGFLELNDCRVLGVLERVPVRGIHPSLERVRWYFPITLTTRWSRAPTGIRASRALPIDDVERGTIFGARDASWIPAGWNEAHHGGA